VLPTLGVGISTELGAAATGLDPLALRAARPELVRFLEVGADLARGVDAVARGWSEAGFATTYHLLDANLEEGDDLTDAWIAETAALARSLGAAWLCGDAGLWHVGPRDRGHGVLLPPVLTPASARAMAENVRRLRLATGLEVLPENPPAHVYLGELHVLDYFARVAEAADAGLLLDVAHLAIHQRATGRAPLDGFDDFPLERVVEVHVAGATEFAHAGRRFVDDDHAPEPLADTWEILAWVLPRAPNLRAIVYECERNPREAVVANFERIAKEWDAARTGAPSAAPRSPRTAPDTVCAAAVRRIQRTLVRMQHDPGFAARLRARDGAALDSTGLAPEDAALLCAADAVAVAADRDDARAAQLLRNVASEFRASAAVGPHGDGSADWTLGFPRSGFFHEAIASDASLPLAFARYAESCAEAAPSALFRALVALDAAMARARRDGAIESTPIGDAVRLAAGAALVALPAGTHAAAAALAGDPADRALRVDAEAREHVLVARVGPPARFGRLPELRVEPLAAAVAALLAAARTPLDAAGLARFAAEHELEVAELDAVVDEFVADGVLVRGGPR
jgi:uncharacterized protein (UPF0276 family)